MFHSALFKDQELIPFSLCTWRDPQGSEVDLDIMVLQGHAAGARHLRAFWTRVLCDPLNAVLTIPTTRGNKARAVTLENIK